MKAFFKWHLDNLSPPQIREKEEKKRCQSWTPPPPPPLTKPSGSAHGKHIKHTDNSFSASNQTTTVATPRPTREPEKCFIEPNLKTFCKLPDDFEDISLWELSAIAFADSVIDELLINCKRGEWCLSVS